MFRRRTTPEPHVEIEWLRAKLAKPGSRASVPGVERGRRLAVLLTHAREWEAAEAEFRALLPEAAKLLGPRQQFVLDSWDELGCVLRDVGRIDEAVEIHAKVLDLRVPPRHGPDERTRITRLRLALALLDGDRWAEAIDWYRGLLADDAAEHGPASPRACGHRLVLATLYQALGRDDTAAEVLQGYAEAVGQENLPPGARLMQAELAVREGGLDLEEALAEGRRLVAGATPAVRQIFVGLLSEHDRHDEALEQLADHLDDRVGRFGEDDRRTYGVRQQLAYHQVESGRLAEGEQNARAVLDVRRFRLAPHCLLGARLTLARAAFHRGRFAEAALDLEQLVTEFAALCGEHHRLVVQVRRWLGDAREAQEKARG